MSSSGFVSPSRVDDATVEPVRSCAVIKRLAVAAIALWLGTGCRSKPASAPPATGPLTFDDDSGAAAAGTPEPEDGTPGPAGCKASGTPWDGKQEGCLYEVAGCCYADAQQACQAAGCEGTQCQVLESAPAQIVCRPS